MIQFIREKKPYTPEAPMNINSISTPLKTLFSQPSIINLARETGFMSRLRGLEPLKLLAALCNVLGTRDKANLADIQRELCALSASAPAYKPFHNQFKKEKLTDFMRKLVMLATEQLLVAPFKTAAPASLPFERIHVHDGSTLKLHDGLKKTFPGRFTKTAPAAVELHLTMDLLSGGVDHMAIDADKESERQWQPFANESAGTLNLLDAGYFDINYVSQTAQCGGHCIIRAKSNINPVIVNARDSSGRRVKVSGLSLLHSSRTRYWTWTFPGKNTMGRTVLLRHGIRGISAMATSSPRCRGSSSVRRRYSNITLCAGRLSFCLKS